jgi:hypothetical protein
MPVSQGFFPLAGVVVWTISMLQYLRSYRIYCYYESIKVFDSPDFAMITEYKVQSALEFGLRLPLVPL